MRALRVVGYGRDGDDGVVIFEDPERRERFSVPADERLRAAARGDVAGLGQIGADPPQPPAPRVIQARIRAGASVRQVADEAGVAPSRIERFAYPVLLERARMAEVARAAHPVREDGPDVRTLAEVVEQTLGARGQSYQRARWDAWRDEDNRWVLTLRWDVGRSDITARWAYRPGSRGGTVTALDEQATDLVEGSVRPPRRVAPVVDRSGSAPEPGPRAVSTVTGSGGRAGAEPAADGRAGARPEDGAPRPAPRTLHQLARDRGVRDA